MPAVDDSEIADGSVSEIAAPERAVPRVTRRGSRQQARTQRDAGKNDALDGAGSDAHAGEGRGRGPDTDSNSDAGSDQDAGSDSDAGANKRKPRKGKRKARFKATQHNKKQSKKREAKDYKPIFVDTVAFCHICK